MYSTDNSVFIHSYILERLLKTNTVYNILSHVFHFIHITVISHSSQKDTQTHFQIISCKTPENTEMWNFNIDQSRRRNWFHPQRRESICLQGRSLPLSAQIKGKQQREHCGLFKTAIKLRRKQMGSE